MHCALVDIISTHPNTLNHSIHLQIIQIIYCTVLISSSAPSVNCLRGSCAKVNFPSGLWTFSAASWKVKPRTCESPDVWRFKKCCSRFEIEMLFNKNVETNPIVIISNFHLVYITDLLWVDTRNAEPKLDLQIPQEISRVCHCSSCLLLQYTILGMIEELSIFSPASASSLVLLSTPSKADRSTSWPLEILSNPSLCQRMRLRSFWNVLTPLWSWRGLKHLATDPSWQVPCHTSTFSLVGRSKLPSRMVTVVPRSVDSTRTFSFWLFCGTLTGNVSHNSDAGKFTSRI